MTILEFVSNLFDAHPVTPERMTIEQAEKDLQNFRREGWELPNDITPAEYMEEWNALIK